VVPSTKNPASLNASTGSPSRREMATSCRNDSTGSVLAYAAGWALLVERPHGASLAGVGLVVLAGWIAAT
ncbi:MAG: hypothetical protein ABMA64_22035, partial [Myxococcota bacterium]